MSGCGIKGGAVYGKSDALGNRVVEGEIGAGQLFATIYKARLNGAKGRALKRRRRGPGQHRFDGQHVAIAADDLWVRIINRVLRHGIEPGRSHRRSLGIGNADPDRLSIDCEMRRTPQWTRQFRAPAIEHHHVHVEERLAGVSTRSRPRRATSTTSASAKPAASPRTTPTTPATKRATSSTSR